MLLPVRLYDLSIIEKCEQNINELNGICKGLLQLYFTFLSNL